MKREVVVGGNSPPEGNHQSIWGRWLCCRGGGRCSSYLVQVSVGIGQRSVVGWGGNNSWGMVGWGGVSMGGISWSSIGDWSLDGDLVGVGVRGGQRSDGLNDWGMVGNWGSNALHDWSVVGQRGVVGSGQWSWSVGGVSVGWGAVGQRCSEVSGRDGGEEQRESQELVHFDVVWVFCLFVRRKLKKAAVACYTLTH